MAGDSTGTGSNDRTLRAKNATTGTKRTPGRKALPKKPRKEITRIDPAIWGRKFLAEYAKGHRIVPAAAAAGVSVSTIYKRKDNDPDFAADMEAVQNAIRSAVDDEIYYRGVVGEEEVTPIFIKGGNDEDTGMPIVAHMADKVTRKTSDRMLELLAKSLMPEKYGDRVTVYNVDLSSEIRRVAGDQNVPPEMVASRMNDGVRRLMKEQGEEDRRRGFPPRKTG